MARTYRPVDREQEFLLPPNMIDWLGEDHLVWFVIEAVARLDTTAFHRSARLGGVGRRGYDPDMLLTLFVYAMAHGVSSSRRIERLCHTDVAFRVICAQDTPDHTVLARFRQHHQAALTDLLTQSLVLAAQLGMVSLGVVALDGTKIAANAGKHANRGEARLRALAQQFVDEVTATDAAEDAVFGQDKRGDEPPSGMRDRTGRRRRIEQALQQLTERREQAEKHEAAQAEQARACERAVVEGVKGRGRYPRGADRVEMAAVRWRRARASAADRYQRWQAARGRGENPGGRPAVPPDEHHTVRKAWAVYQGEVDKAGRAAAARAAADDATGAATAGGAGQSGRSPRANLTDPGSRLLKTRDGWVQGYNCQTAASQDGFIVSARATQDANDLDQFIATMDDVVATAQALAERTGRVDLRVGVLLADAGYDCDANLAAEGPDRLIADGKRRVVDQRAAAEPAVGDPPEGAGARERMTHRLRTPEGHALYKRRSPLVEAPNAWLKDGRGLRRFARRGVDAVQSELSFASAVTNLLKIATKGVTAARLRAC